MSDSPAAILFDELGNPVGVIQDGVFYRLQVEAKIAADQEPIPFFIQSAAVTRTSVNASLTDVLLAPTNILRKGLIILNNTMVASLKLGLGSVPTSGADFTIIIGPRGYWPVPFGFTGEIRGIWDGTDGYALITELS